MDTNVLGGLIMIDIPIDLAGQKQKTESSVVFATFLDQHHLVSHVVAVKKVEFKKYIQDLDTFYTLGFPAF